MLESENINSEESNNYYSNNPNCYIKEKLGNTFFSEQKCWFVFYVVIILFFFFCGLICYATPLNKDQKIIWIAPWYIWLLVVILFIIFTVFFIGYEYRFIIDLKRGMLIKEIKFFSHIRGQKITNLNNIKLIVVTKKIFFTERNSLEHRRSCPVEVIAFYIDNKKVKKVILESVNVDERFIFLTTINANAKLAARSINAQFIPIEECYKIKIIKKTIDNDDINSAVKIINYS